MGFIDSESAVINYFLSTSTRNAGEQRGRGDSLKPSMTCNTLSGCNVTLPTRPWAASVPCNVFVTLSTAPSKNVPELKAQLEQILAAEETE